MTDTRYTGRIKWFDPQKKYGFIIVALEYRQMLPDLGESGDLYFPLHAWATTGLPTEGIRVTFSVRKSGEKLKAHDVLPEVRNHICINEKPLTMDNTQYLFVTSSPSRLTWDDTSELRAQGWRRTSEIAAVTNRGVVFWQYIFVKSLKEAS